MKKFFKKLTEKIGKRNEEEPLQRRDLEITALASSISIKSIDRKQTQEKSGFSIDASIREVKNPSMESNMSLVEGGVIEVNESNKDIPTSYKIEKIHSVTIDGEEFSLDSIQDLKELLNLLKRRLSAINRTTGKIVEGTNDVTKRAILLKKKSQYEIIAKMVEDKRKVLGITKEV